MPVSTKTPPLSTHRFVAEWSRVKHWHSQAERENVGMPTTNLSVGFGDFGGGHNAFARMGSGMNRMV